MCGVIHEKILWTVASYCILPINHFFRAAEQNYRFYCKWLVKIEIIYMWFYLIQSGIIVIVWAGSTDFGRLSKEHFYCQNLFFCHHRHYLFLKTTDFSINSIYNHYDAPLINGNERDTSHSFLMFSDKVLISEDLLNTR